MSDFIPPDERHELGCVRRYGATERDRPDTDEEAAACSCHRHAKQQPTTQTEGEAYERDPCYGVL